MAASSLLLIVGALLGSASAQSGCYNAAGDHACVCATLEADCTGTWTSTCGCSRVDSKAPPKPECSLDTTYHMNGGYYIEGINGVDKTDRTAPNGRIADKTHWLNDTYYPHGEMKLCTGMFCSEAARTVGSAQTIFAHTCAKLRFTYTADSGSTVYEMPTKAAFEACDFTGATLKCAANAGSPCDVHYEANDEQKVYYYASQNACTTGQKVAVNLGDHFSDNYAQCFGMGAGSSRIQHCDCDHHLKVTTTIEPCFTGFVNGCKADMPDDLSCCPGADASYDMGYVNGGQCIPKSKLEGFKDVAVRVHEMMHCNKTELDEHAAMEVCPKLSPYGSAREPVCTMVKKVLECDVLSPAADCAKEHNYKLFVEHTNTLKTPVCPAGSPAPAKTTTLTSTLTLAGTLASLTNTDKLNIKKTIAKGAGVKHSAVSVAYAAGSVVVTATITVADAAAATAAAKKLNTGIMASETALATALKAEGVTTAVAGITAVVDPSAPPVVVPAKAKTDSDDGLSVGAIVGIAVGVIVGALALIGLLVVVVKKQKPAAKKVETGP